MKKEKETVQKIKTIEFDDITITYNASKINKLAILKYNIVYFGLVLVSILLGVLSIFELHNILYPWALILVSLLTIVICTILSMNLLNIMIRDKRAINLISLFLRVKSISVLFNNKGNTSLVINNNGRVYTLKYLLKDTGIPYKIVNTAKVTDNIVIDIDATSNDIINVNIKTKDQEDTKNAME